MAMLHKMMTILHSHHEQAMNTMILALAYLKDLDLHDAKYQFAIVKSNGLDALFGVLLSSHDDKVKIGAATIMSKLATHGNIFVYSLLGAIQVKIAEGGMKILLKGIKDANNANYRSILCQIVAHCCQRSKSRSIFLIHDGPLIVAKIVTQCMELVLTNKLRIVDHVNSMHNACNILWHASQKSLSIICSAIYNYIRRCTAGTSG